MAHFEGQVWADYVRGLGPRDLTLEVDAHLARNCAECLGAKALWGRVHTFSTRDREYAPPADLVRMAKFHYSLEQPDTPDMWSVADLVFDSAMQPLPAGIRGGTMHARQVVYEAESLTVDMRFERKVPGSAISVAGQVLDREAPLSWVNNAVIVLWTEKGRMVTRTEVNECGEFQLEFEVQNQLRMSVITMGRKTLRIALGSFD